MYSLPCALVIRNKTNQDMQSVKDFDAEKDLDETIDLSDADMDEAQESMMDESDIEDLKSDKKAE